MVDLVPSLQCYWPSYVYRYRYRYMYVQKNVVFWNGARCNLVHRYPRFMKPAAYIFRIDPSILRQNIALKRGYRSAKYTASQPGGRYTSKLTDITTSVLM